MNVLYRTSADKVSVESRAFKHGFNVGTGQVSSRVLKLHGLLGIDIIYLSSIADHCVDSCCKDVVLLSR